MASNSSFSVTYKPLAGPAVSSLQASQAAALSTGGAAAAAFATALAAAPAAPALAELSLTEKLLAALQDSNKKMADARAAACDTVAAVAEIVGAAAQPTVTTKVLRDVLTLACDKAGKSVTDKAEDAGRKAFGAMNRQVKHVYGLKDLLDAMGPGNKWQTQVLACELLGVFADTAGEQCAASMPEIVPVVTLLLCEPRAQVSETSRTALEKCCATIDNKDIGPFIPSLIDALANPTLVEDCIDKLAATTFVQQVEKSALSIIVPLLNRGFQTRSTPVVRMCSVIIENMTKLVERASDVAPFIPLLMPQLVRAAEEISDPEARAVASRVVERLENTSKGVGLEPEAPPADVAAVRKVLDGVVGSMLKPAENALVEAHLQFIATLCCSLIDLKMMEKEDWEGGIKQHLEPFVDNAGDVCYLLNTQCVKFAEVVEEQDVDEDVENLCDCKFSLAYGNKVLLNNTGMVLKRGFKYGLLGANDCGKTTLMRAISKHQIDGFPEADEVRTVFVEADILGALSHLNIVDYVFADERIQAANISRESIMNVLTSVGFNDVMLKGGVSHLSGGWRMKLALARAMLQKADILLLDEPTNHLDVLNVKWVESYIQSLQGVTCIMVSHDSGFLERCTTHIIQIENLKLKTFKGSLKEFVEANPAAKSFFELKSDKFKFTFPQPGPLEGITSKGKPVMKMDNVDFTYPGAARPQITGVTVRVALSTRAACVGPNGAGKSTMIKLLTGETEPDSGTVWKHPNCRVGYIAQHAFHHIENHLTKTPNEYIRWRYQYGEDREALQKDTMKVTEEELKIMKEPLLHVWKDENEKEHKEKFVIDRLTGQRRLVKGSKNDYEYEIKWVGKPTTFTHWLSFDKLKELGWEKHTKAVDEKVASRASAFHQPLTQANVEKHIENVGLDREFGTHSKIGALSGGQKVKVVLAAAMWNMPHIIILDEPTNYLDRDSLGALAGAIKEYDGGVVIISHNNEFVGTVCPETWNLIPPTETESAKLECKGDVSWMEAAMKEKVEVKQIDEITDAFGNTIKVAPSKKKALSRADKKKMEKKRAAQKRNGTYVPGCNGTDEEDMD